ETYTTLLPALVMGNTLVMKPPRMGLFCHLPMLEDFMAAFPPGVVNVITGDGESTAGPIMATGEVDVLAFIGSARVAHLAEKDASGSEPPSIRARPRREEPRHRASGRRPRSRRQGVPRWCAHLHGPALYGVENPVRPAADRRPFHPGLRCRAECVEDRDAVRG